LAHDAQQPEIHTRIDFPALVYNQYPGSDGTRLDLAGGDFTIDFDDPLPWGELVGKSGSLEESSLKEFYVSCSHRRR